MSESSIHNPLFEAWQSHKNRGRDYRGSYIADLMDRIHFGKRMQLTYAWAIPSQEAIEYLVSLGKIVEIGAGRGYWASLIIAAGGDVICYDENPPSPTTENNWAPPRVSEPFEYAGDINIEKHVFTDVLAGGPEKAADHADRALLLCWPIYDSPMAYDCLRQYRGNLLIYVGEGRWGCTADDQFFDLLESEWEKIHLIAIPRWDNLGDNLVVYKRK